jgi:hypothetical protein
MSVDSEDHLQDTARLPRLTCLGWEHPDLVILEETIPVMDCLHLLRPVGDRLKVDHRDLDNHHRGTARQDKTSIWGCIIDTTTGTGGQRTWGAALDCLHAPSTEVETKMAEWDYLHVPSTKARTDTAVTNPVGWEGFLRVPSTRMAVNANFFTKSTISDLGTPADVNVLTKTFRIL